MIFTGNIELQDFGEKFRSIQRQIIIDPITLIDFIRGKAPLHLTEHTKSLNPHFRASVADHSSNVM